MARNSDLGTRSQQGENEPVRERASQAPASQGRPLAKLNPASKNVAELASANLVVDFEYEGGVAGNARDEPIHHLLGVSNQGGFRYIGKSDALRMLVLFSSFDDADWPDSIDPSSGIFVYFGDNKQPGRELHDTPRRGNQILRSIFNSIHATPAQREHVPPIFVFSRGSRGRNVVFRGVAVPGAIGAPSTQDLVAVWKATGGRRYQNYRATFTILNVPIINRCWIKDVQNGCALSENAPLSWRNWQEGGLIDALRAEATREFRTREEQLPTSLGDSEFLRSIYERYRHAPYDFEVCAAELARLHLGQVISIAFTPPSRDGGRDGIGKYLIGVGRSSVPVEFATEAKCYKPQNAVGVRELSRLISRIRHRQFGLLVTTSYLHKQAYEELIEDSHPIVVIAGMDIVDILRRHGFASVSALERWLEALPTHSSALIAQQSET